MVLPGLREPPGCAPDRVDERPAGHRGRAVSPVDPPAALPAAASSREQEPLVAAIVGARGSGKSRLIESLKQAFAGDSSLIAARFEGRGLDPSLAERLRSVRRVEVPGYPRAAESDSRRNRPLRQSAVAAAIDCDLLILVIDGRKGLQPADVSLAQAWDRYFIEHPQREVPPTLVVITGVDHPDFGVVWGLPTTGRPARECARPPSAPCSTRCDRPCRRPSAASPPPAFPVKRPSVSPNTSCPPWPRNCTGPNVPP